MMAKLGRSVPGMLAAVAALGGNLSGSGGRQTPERNDGSDDMYMARAIAKRKRKAAQRVGERESMQDGKARERARRWLLNYYTLGSSWRSAHSF